MMPTERPSADFPDLSEDNRRRWDANARWWDDRIGDGNDFQTLLIEPATERLLDIRAGDVILDVACGAGRFARRMAERAATIVAFDYSGEFVARARERTPAKTAITYHSLDAADPGSLMTLGAARFDKAVCTMALMDMPEIGPLFATLPRLLKPAGSFVFSILHPCFHSAAIQRFAELHEEQAGRHVMRAGVKISSYLSPSARQSEGIIGQPEPQWLFHRSLSALLRYGFDAGFWVDGLEEPALPATAPPKAGVRWHDMPEIPPIMVVRMTLDGRRTG